MMIDREELAARIFVTQLCDDDCGLDALCSWSFDMADTFLEYAAKQREPNACEHRWVTVGGECYHCQWCKIPKVNVDKQKVKPEPPKPERVARELWLYKDYADQPWTATETEPKSHWNYKFKVREILPEDEHDKR